ncbi:MAG: GNAT family N-acetyltransferase [Parafilimonas sp.]
MSAFSLTPFRELITSRLMLRRLTDEDVKFIYELRSNEDVNKFIGRPLAASAQEALNFIKLINDNISKNKSLYWLIVLKNENKPVGTITLWQFSADKNSAEIGYELLPAYQCKGIMQEAVKRIISYAFDDLSLKKLGAFMHEDNKASAKLLEKNNFKRDREAEKLEEKNIELKEMLIYSLTNSNE